MSVRRDRVTREFHERVMAACANSLTEDLVRLHAPEPGSSDLVCHGCVEQTGAGEEFDVLWPCRTYRMIAEQALDLQNVLTALKALLAGKLTTTQLEFMRFLAGYRPDPPRRTCETYQVLVARGLIERHGSRQVYRLTERGQQTLAALSPGISADPRSQALTRSSKGRSVRRRVSRPANRSRQGVRAPS